MTIPKDKKSRIGDYLGVAKHHGRRVPDDPDIPRHTGTTGIFGLVDPNSLVGDAQSEKPQNGNGGVDDELPPDRHSGLTQALDAVQLESDVGPRPNQPLRLNPGEYTINPNYACIVGAYLDSTFTNPSLLAVLTGPMFLGFHRSGLGSPSNGNGSAHGQPITTTSGSEPAVQPAPSVPPSPSGGDLELAPTMITPPTRLDLAPTRVTRSVTSAQVDSGGSSSSLPEVPTPQVIRVLSDGTNYFPSIKTEDDKSYLIVDESNFHERESHFFFHVRQSGVNVPDTVYVARDYVVKKSDFFERVLRHVHAKQSIPLQVNGVYIPRIIGDEICLSEANRKYATIETNFPEELITVRKRSISESVSLVTRIARAMQEIHTTYGVVHGNISPSAVRIGKNEDGAEEIYLVDFGIDGRDGPNLYRPSEQINNQVTTHQTDVYSLCALLARLVTGNEPQRNVSRGRVCYDFVCCYAPEADLDPNDDKIRDLKTIMGKGLHRTPQNRHASMSVLADELKGWLTTYQNSQSPALSESKPVDDQPASLLYRCLVSGTVAVILGVATAYLTLP